MGISGLFFSNTNEENLIQNEGHIKGHSTALTKHQTKVILEQIDNSICRIENNDLTGTGFLCLIPDSDIYHLQPVLITCNHVLGKKDLINGNNIKLIFENKERTIVLDKSRIIYTNNSYDTTIIELKKDEFPYNSFLKIDYCLDNKNLNDIYKNKTVYIIHYPNGKEPKYSIDTVSNITDGLIKHCCTTDFGSSGSPILNLETFNVIGIHRGKSTNFNFNFGIAINLPIIGFNKTKFEIKKDNNLSLLENENKSLTVKIQNLENEIKKCNDENKKLLNEINQMKYQSMLDIISKNFHQMKQKLLIELNESLNLSDLTEFYENEIIKKFKSKVNVVFDINFDKSDIINFISKIIGLSDLSIFITLFNEEKKAEPLIQFVYLNGKIEINNYAFSFNNICTFSYGNYESSEAFNFKFTFFEPQNSSIYIKIKSDYIYAMFYRDDYDIKLLIKIKANFKDKSIICVNKFNIDEEGDFDTEKNVILNKEKIDQFFEKQKIWKIGI